MTIHPHCLSIREQRLSHLVQHNNDTSRLDSSQVDFDFSTDSWGQLKLPYMTARMSILKQRAAQHPLDIQQVLARHFPFRNFISTSRGRDAESLLFTALAKSRVTVVQNILFHTARGHQLKNNMIPLELPHPQAFTDDDFPFKGNLDLDKLERVLATETVSLIFIEALSNGVGGHPISIENLRAIRALADKHNVPLYLDATRAVENCVLIREREPEFKDCALRDIVQKLFSYCDGITSSLVKDYGVTAGGLLATNSSEVYCNARDQVLPENVILDDGEQAWLAQAIDDYDNVEIQVQARMQQVNMLGMALQQAGFPVRLPVGGHAVILDLALINDAGKSVIPNISSYQAWLYKHTGMRGAQHWGGATPEHQRPLWIRLAVPLGFTAMDQFIAALTPATENMFCAEQA